MANAKGKTKQVKPVAAAIAACFAIVYPALVDSAKQSAENATRRASRSETCVAGIKSLCDSITDAKERAAAVVTLFGNGEKKKETRVAGTLFEKLKADNVKDVTTFSLLHHCRTVAANWSNADVRKAAQESGIRAGYDATKAPKEASTTEQPKAAKVVTLSELIAEMVRTFGGDVTILRMIESALIANKKPIHAAAVHDAAVKLTALAA